MPGLEAKEAWVGELGLNAEVNCDGCGQPRPYLGSNRMYNNFVEKCRHILCSYCLEDTALENSGSESSHHCPLCRQYGAGSSHNQQIDDEGDTEMASSEQPASSTASDYFNEEGYSTKMAALIRDVKSNLLATKR